MPIISRIRPVTRQNGAAKSGNPELPRYSPPIKKMMLINIVNSPTIQDADAKETAEYWYFRKIFAEAKPA